MPNTLFCIESHSHVAHSCFRWLDVGRADNFRTLDVHSHFLLVAWAHVPHSLPACHKRQTNPKALPTPYDHEHLFLCQAAATELIRLGVLSLFGLMHLQQLQSFKSPGFKFATYGLPTEKTKVDLKYWPRNPGLFRSLSCRAPPLAMKHHKQPRSNPKTSLFLPSSRTACNPCMQ